MPWVVFDREKERMCGPDGFLDSARYQHSFQVRKEKKDARNGDAPTTRVTVVDLLARKEKSQKEYDKRLKVVEVRQQI